MEPHGKTEVIKIAEDYFDYMARKYPVMCLSDEFYFFPRAKKGIRYLDTLDSLDEEKIKQDISYIKNLKRNLEKIRGFKDLEAEIDFVLLRQNMSSFLREFEQVKIWQKDPTVYLKIMLIGIEHLTVKLPFIKSMKADIDDYLISRIRQIPRLLNEAKRNLKKIPPLYLKISSEMINFSINYFKDFAPKEIIQSLMDFKIFLKEKPAYEAFVKNKKLLQDILKDSFSYKRSLEEIFSIAYREYHHALKNLEVIANKIDSKKTWQKILYQYAISAKNEKALLRLYSNRIKGLINFFNEKDIITISKTQEIKVKKTPEFMIPVRASASYSCPVTDNPKEPAFFYITPEFGSSRKSLKKGYSSVHIEYIFVTAHETYPGHHLLDSIRKNLQNPIRGQIESPLFYEGWASYAESLIDRLGYIKDPLQQLVGLRRQAWRAVRAMLDVGIRTGKFEVGDAEILLKNLGYAPRVVKLMLRHYVLTPGYQLCYTIGKFEIERLKNKFASKLGLKKFHDFLLEGGQIPFDLIEKRMENICRENS